MGSHQDIMNFEKDVSHISKEEETLSEYNSKTVRLPPYLNKLNSIRELDSSQTR